jgi:hypothetical protein
MTDDVAARKARSMLMLVLATCQQTLLALEAAGNVLDVDLSEDLRSMVARTNKELKALSAKIDA